MHSHLQSAVSKTVFKYCPTLCAGWGSVYSRAVRGSFLSLKSQIHPQKLRVTVILSLWLLVFTKNVNLRAINIENFLPLIQNWMYFWKKRQKIMLVMDFLKNWEDLPLHPLNSILIPLWKRDPRVKTGLRPHTCIVVSYTCCSYWPYFSCSYK